VHDDLVDELRGKQRIADAAAHLRDLVQHEPVAGRDVVAVEQRLGQARVRAAHADAVVLVESALVRARGADRDAGQSSQGIGDVLVRHLADVLGGDDLDNRVRLALRVQRLLVRYADAGYDDFAELLLRPRRIVLCEESDGDRGSDQRRPCAFHVL
jgi:hypothetical protein